MASPDERPYNESDLAGNKTSLVKFVQRQLSRWPGQGKFQPTKVTASQLKSALLDPTYGFTTNQPLVTSPHPPKSNSRGSTAAGTLNTISTTPVETPVENPAHTPAPASVGPVETLEVRVYVEDRQYIPSQKTVAILPLSVLDRNCGPGSFRVLSRELVSALQESNGAIEIVSGTVRFSFPDPENSEGDWKIPFARILHGQALEVVTFNPEALEISDDQRFRLFVDNVVALHSPVKNEPGDSKSTSISDSAAPTASRQPEPQSATDPAVQFLREKLQTRDGYQSFAANRGRVLINTEVVKNWQFAVDFARDYDKLRSPKVTRQSVYTALGIGSTWMSQANTAIEIVGKYGHITEVAKVLQQVEDPEGSTALYKFLTGWKEKHPL
ncbi:hypothetical protein B0H11DRAFT_1996106 [Mycena galericulata]|nr:hypothetical protein B0H11DRAFT_1996106 [Mycena galericulata]